MMVFKPRMAHGHLVKVGKKVIPAELLRWVVKVNVFQEGYPGIALARSSLDTYYALNHEMPDCAFHVFMSSHLHSVRVS